MEGFAGFGPNPCETMARRRASASESVIDTAHSPNGVLFRLSGGDTSRGPSLELGGAPTLPPSLFGSRRQPPCRPLERGPIRLLPGVLVGYAFSRRQSGIQKRHVPGRVTRPAFLWAYGRGTASGPKEEGRVRRSAGHAGPDRSRRAPLPRVQAESVGGRRAPVRSRIRKGRTVARAAQLSALSHHDRHPGDRRNLARPWPHPAGWGES